MKRDVVFKGSAFSDFNEWESKNNAIYRKIAELIEDIRRNPFSGKGKPEPLKYKFAGYWSRRISEEHRLVYTVTEDEVQIVSCKYHYTGK
jgi:toxin YoeB